jgi:hypothetical protein
VERRDKVDLWLLLYPRVKRVGRPLGIQWAIGPYIKGHKLFYYSVTVEAQVHLPSFRRQFSSNCVILDTSLATVATLRHRLEIPKL